MKKIIIIGGKGTPVVIAEQILNAVEKYSVKFELLGFAFDDESFGNEINGIPILDKTYNVYDKYKKFEDVFYVYSLYRSDVIEERVKLRESLKIPIEKYVSFVHPLATVARSAQIGYGNIILANVVINPNVKIGNFNTFNSNSLVGHDTVMGDNNFVAGHSVIGSNLKIGNGNFFGLNSSSKNFIKIGDYNIIGMAANLVKDVQSRQIMIGNPARPLSK
jgi:acetyltransferase EpsM